MVVISRNRAELQGARELLEKAHAYIEEFHFGISDYGEPGAPGCYIGTMRMAADLRPEPRSFGDPADGGGDGLEYALRLLDHLVLVRLDPNKNYTNLERRRDSAHAGRMAEVCGIILSDELKEQFGDKEVAEEVEEAIALGVFRKALTIVHQQLEELDQLEADRDLVPA